MRYILIVFLFLTFSFSNSLMEDKVKNACIKDKIPEACYTLALVYSKGFGAKKDTVKATFYYDLANKYGISKVLENSQLDINTK